MRLAIKQIRNVFGGSQRLPSSPVYQCESHFYRIERGPKNRKFCVAWRIKVQFRARLLCMKLFLDTLPCHGRPGNKIVQTVGTHQEPDLLVKKFMERVLIPMIGSALRPFALRRNPA
jgi:hypothetical protein